ncbi:MAG: hypothetical protein JSV80_10565, partial [Acidobacteriota bacterium]
IDTSFYPHSAHSRYPHYGSLARSSFDVTFLHDVRHEIVASGVKVEERAGLFDDSAQQDYRVMRGREEQPKEYRMTRWRMEHAVHGFGFAVGPFEPHREPWPEKEDPVTVEFFGLGDDTVYVKSDFVAAEMINSLNYFQRLFGKYPYERLGTVYHPRRFGQGLASLLLLPKADRESKYTFSFIAHEAAHQWWGNIVCCRSYRDQWLSEGFSEYSGVLYTGLRDSKKSERELIRYLRDSLKVHPRGSTQRMYEIAPLVLGNRSITRKTPGAYFYLAYHKGALVLRMLHFLFTDPASGEGQPFFDMLSDFVDQHRGGWATTESFIQVANERFPESALGERYGFPDLNWFFRQWVYETYLPTYRLEYRLVGQKDGSVVVEGHVLQEDAPEYWLMPLPLVFGFGGDAIAHTTVIAHGPKAPFRLQLPRRPKKVELDPDHWVLSAETSTGKLR